MSNRFYTFVNQLISGSVAKASEVNAELQGAEVGFLAVEGELNTAIKFPANESTTNQRIVESPAQRAGKLMAFDDDGALVVTNQLQGDINVGPARLRYLVPAVENDEPVTLAQMSAYSAGLAGLPSITGRLGHLTTDGSSVAWSGPGRMVPETGSIGAGNALLFSGGAAGECVWLPHQNNAALDPNGVLGAAYWSSSLIRFNNVDGYLWTNSSILSGSTFDHIPTVAGRIDTGPGKVMTGSVSVNAFGSTAGTITPTFWFYNSGGTLLSSSPGTAIAAGQVEKVFSLTVTAPASTAYAAFGLVFSSVSSPAYGIIIKNLKVESGYYATPFNDAKTFGLAYGVKQLNYFGTGYANPIITIGDTSSTLACLDLRSQTGSQQYDARIQCASGVNGTSGKGAVQIYAQRITTSGPVGAMAEYDAGNSGSAITIDFGNNGQFQKLTLNAATPTITLSTIALPVGRYQLRLIQDAVGGRAPTWSGLLSANCLGNVPPIISSGANAVTFISLFFDGSQWWASGNPWD